MTPEQRKRFARRVANKMASERYCDPSSRRRVAEIVSDIMVAMERAAKRKAKR